MLFTAKGVVLALVALFLVALLLIGGAFGCKAYGRYQKRADAKNNVKVTAIQIHNQEQRVKIAQQKAQIRFVEATGIRRAQDEIALTLTPLYVQHEMIQALRESGATTVYIPTDPASGLPVVTTRNAGGSSEYPKADGMSNLEIAAQLQREFPLMWAAAMNADNRERLGLRVDQYDEEAARAMHELWLARTNSTALPSAE